MPWEARPLKASGRVFLYGVESIGADLRRADHALLQVLNKQVRSHAVAPCRCGT